MTKPNADCFGPTAIDFTDAQAMLVLDAVNKRVLRAELNDTTWVAFDLPVAITHPPDLIAARDGAFVGDAGAGTFHAVNKTGATVSDAVRCPVAQ